MGDNSSKFTAIFEGNNHTIANLWVNVTSTRAGLFGVTGGSAEIRNVGVISGGVSSSCPSYSGSLVGYSATLIITHSYGIKVALKQ